MKLDRRVSVKAVWTGNQRPGHETQPRNKLNQVINPKIKFHL